MFWLKILYLKTYINQTLNHDGAFPFRYYKELIEVCRDRDIKNALELGTALGLTAASFLYKKDLHLITIEKHARLIEKANKNIVGIYGEEVLNRVEFVEGRYFDVLDKWQEGDENKKFDKKFDLVFMDAYVSRYNEVEKFSHLLAPGGVYIVSNIREDIEKSVAAKVFLLKSGMFEHLKTVDDTIFVIKK